MKRRWEKKVRDSGGDLNVRKPNLVMGANVQVCWEKFCRYWDVEGRLVPVTEDALFLTPEGAAAACERRCGVSRRPHGVSNRRRPQSATCSTSICRVLSWASSGCTSPCNLR